MVFVYPQSAYFKFCWYFQKLFAYFMGGGGGGGELSVQTKITVLNSISSMVLSVPLDSPSCQASLL